MDWDLPTIIFVSTPNQANSIWTETLGVVIGAILGGLIAFLTTFFFQHRERQETRRVRAYALYLNIAKSINDVYAIWSRYDEMLEGNDWPIEPWTVMLPIVGKANVEQIIPHEQLTSISGERTKYLANDILELSNFRNIILEATEVYSARRQVLTEVASKKSKVKPGMKIAATLSKNDDADLIFEINQVDNLAKQLLVMLSEFKEKAAKVAETYNDYAKSSKMKSIRDMLIEMPSEPTDNANEPAD